MSPEVLNHAIEPFFTTKKVGEGSGLGLSMIHGFAKQSGGHLALYSEPGHGTTVKLYLPLAGPSESESRAPKFLETLPQGHGEVVLIIEDDPDVRRLAVKMVGRLGYDVIEAPEAAEALSVLGAGKKRSIWCCRMSSCRAA